MGSGARKALTVACTLQRASEAGRPANRGAGGGQVPLSPQARNEVIAVAARRDNEADEATGQLSGPPATLLPEFLENFCRYLFARRTTEVVFCGALRAARLLRTDLPRARASDPHKCATSERQYAVQRRSHADVPHACTALGGCHARVNRGLHHLADFGVRHRPQDREPRKESAMGVYCRGKVAIQWGNAEAPVKLG